MSREVHVRFWERVRVKSPRATRFPLYRQAEIYARVGLEIDRSQRAEWLGQMAWLLRPLVELIGRQVMAGQRHPCRRHAGRRAGPRQRQDQDRSAVGLSAR